jgi:hypothetical protein
MRQVLFKILQMRHSTATKLKHATVQMFLMRHAVIQNHPMRHDTHQNGSGELPKETIGHVQSAWCLGQKEVVTAAHNADPGAATRSQCAWEGGETHETPYD